MSLEFAVFDAETTGFFRERRSSDWSRHSAPGYPGKILRTFHTLIHPDRELPPSRNRKWNDEDFKKAPEFGDIAGEMIDFLAGAVLISHNVVFDLLFIKEEFNRLGHTLPKLSSIRTLELARRLVPEPKSRRLPDVCRELGLSYGGTRSALEEAKATRLVFYKVSSNSKSSRSKILVSRVNLPKTNGRILPKGRSVYSGGTISRGRSPPKQETLLNIQKQCTTLLNGPTQSTRKRQIWINILFYSIRYSKTVSSPRMKLKHSTNFRWN